MILRNEEFFDALLCLNGFNIDAVQSTSQRLRTVVDTRRDNLPLRRLTYAKANARMRNGKMILEWYPEEARVKRMLEANAKTLEPFIRRLHGCHVDRMEITGYRNITEETMQRFVDAAKNISVKGLTIDGVAFNGPNCNHKLLRALLEKLYHVESINFYKCLFASSHLKDGTIGACAANGVRHMIINGSRLNADLKLLDDDCIMKFCLAASNAHSDRDLQWRNANISPDFLRKFIQARIDGLIAPDINVHLMPLGNLSETAVYRPFPAQNIDEFMHLIAQDSRTDHFFEFKSLEMVLHFAPHTALFIKCGSHYKKGASRHAI